MTPIDKYAADHSTEESELLAQLDRETHLRVVQPRMLSGHLQGLMLKMLSHMISPRMILEIGTFTGYSALCLAEGLTKDGTLHTIEIDDELESISKNFFSKSALKDKIRCHIGDALTVAPQIGEIFDLVFIDGDKREYTSYYNMLFDNGLIHSGSFIFADNTLWSGKVVEPLHHNDMHTKNILEFNDMVVKDPRVEVLIVSLRDGVSIIRVK